MYIYILYTYKNTYTCRKNNEKHSETFLPTNHFPEDSESSSEAASEAFRLTTEMIDWLVPLALAAYAYSTIVTRIVVIS